MKFYFSILIALFLSINTSAQTNKLTGTVTDNQAKYVASAIVSLSEVNQTALTDEKGNYKFNNLPQGNYTVTFKMMGFEPKVISIDLNKSTMTLNTTLTPENNTLDEVEVFGVRNKQPDKLQNLTRLP